MNFSRVWALAWILASLEALGATDSWWALRPLVSTPIPIDLQGAGVVHPIDAFIQAKCREQGLTASPEADRRTLIRRASFDLIGLPPTPGAVQRFLSANSEQAYEGLVQELLNSPRYGERWARHWMDTAHFAETHGHDQDRIRAHAWPYRDYLIQAFNADKSYPRFVQEQVAGDILFPEETENIPALGFLAAGPWDESSLRDIREDTLDRQIARYLDRDDVVTTVMQTFTSTTVQCARCHDHKFDPISQDDYYSLQAIFAGVDRASRPYDPDPTVARKRNRIENDLKRVAKRDREFLLSSVSEQAVAQMEPSTNRAPIQWRVLAPETFVSAAGAVLTRQPDGSLLASGKHGPTDVYTISSKPSLDGMPLLPHEIQTALDTPGARRTEAQRLTLAAWYQKITLDRELAALPPVSFVYAGASDFPPDASHKPAGSPRPVHVLFRGEITKPGKLAAPGTLSCVAQLPARFSALLTPTSDEGARRAALAQWLTDRNNPLVWRSIVNRVWHHHFGRGLVETLNDFGAMGTKPSHPELLDWLSVWFRDEAKGSIKQLHRLLVTSHTYRQSSAIPTMKAKARVDDAENRYLSRMNRHRLDAEQVRDALLQISGQLDLRMGGPSDKQFDLQPGIHVTPRVDYTKFDLDQPAGCRRGVYRFLFRTLPDPFMDALDCPAGDQLTPVRTSGVTVQQALALWNNAFAARQAEHLSTRLTREQADLASQIDAGFELAVNRSPTPQERQEAIEYAQHHGLANFVRVLINSNEFMFLD